MLIGDLHLTSVYPTLFNFYVNSDLICMYKCRVFSKTRGMQVPAEAVSAHTVALQNQKAEATVFIQPGERISDRNSYVSVLKVA